MKKIFIIPIIVFLFLCNALTIDVNGDSLNSFETRFIDNNKQDLTDYKINDKGSSLISTYKLEASDDQKILSYIFPEGVDVISIPELSDDLIKADNYKSPSTGITTVTLYYSPESYGINISTNILFNIDSDNFYSNEEFVINSSLTYLSDSETYTSQNKITIHDYSNDISVETEISPISDNITLDTSMPFVMYNTLIDEDNNLNFSDFTVNLDNIKIDVGEILVDLNGTGEYKTINELGALDNISVITNGNYNSEIGIISIGDTAITNTTRFSTFKINFNSNFFNTDTKIKITEDVYTLEAKENYSNNYVKNVFIDQDIFNMVEDDYAIDAFLDLGSEQNGVKPDTEDSYLFSLLVNNQYNSIFYSELDIDIPEGMTLVGFRPPNSSNRNTNVGISDNFFFSFSTNQKGVNVDFPRTIEGPTTVTVDISYLNSYQSNYDFDGSYIESGIRFYGTVSSEYDSLDVTLKDNAQVLDVETGHLDMPNISKEDKTITIDVEDEQSPSIASTDYIFIDKNDNQLDEVSLGDEVVISSTISIDDEYYNGTAYSKLNSPSLLISIPPELVAENGVFTADDIKLIEGKKDISEYIDNFEILDSSDSKYEGGTLLRVDLNNYSLTTNELEIYVNTVVDSELSKPTLIKNINGGIVVDTTDVKNYKDITCSSTSICLEGDDVIKSDGLNQEIQAGNFGYSTLTISINTAMGAKAYVDTDMNDGQYNYISVTHDSSMHDYPAYYLGDEGEYYIEMYNSYAYNNEEPFYSYIVFPDLDEYSAMINISEMTIDSVGSPIDKIYYTTDEVDDTAGWIEQNHDNVTWTLEKPKDTCITAMRFEFTKLEENSMTTVKIPYTTSYAKEEDEMLYTNVMGQSIYTIDDQFSTDGPTAGVMIEKTNPPTISLDSLTGNEVYSSDETELFMNDVMDYQVDDDRTDELVIYDEKKDTFSDGSNDDMGDIEVTYTDLENNQQQYNISELDDDILLAGDYEITYTSEQDSDAQKAEESVNVKVTPGDAEITASNITIKCSDVPKNSDELISALYAVATDYDGYSDVSDTLKIEDFGGFTYDNFAMDTYTIKLSAYGISGNTVYKEVTMEIVEEEPSLTGNDALVELSDAPESLGELKDLMNVEAMDMNAKNITDEVDVTDYNGCNLNTPKVGEFDITYNVTYMDGSQDTMIKTLTVIDDKDEASISDTGFEEGHIYIVMLVIILMLLVKNVYKIICK